MKKLLKIGILIDQLVPGGVQKSAIQEAKELIKLGHSVKLYVLTRTSYEYQYEDISKGLIVEYLSDFNPRFFKKAFSIPYFSFLTDLHLLNPFFAFKYTVLKDLDFIISHGTTTCITASAITKKLGIPYLAFIWDPMLYILEKVYQHTFLKIFFILLRPIIKMYESDFLKSAAIVVTSSKVHQKFIFEMYGINSDVVYPGSSAPKIVIKPKHERKNKYVLGYTRWELAKNPFIFIWLARKLPSEVKILIAGTWTNKNQLESFKKLIYINNLENKILLVSPIAKNDLVRIAHKSFVWIHPNFEALGIAGLEMAACGLPILIPKGSGLTELFIEGIHGFFPEVNDYQTFYKKILYLYHHPQITCNMGLQAAQTAKIYTWKFHSKLIWKHIKNYLSTKKIVCLANAFVTVNSIGGGDRFMIELSKYSPRNVLLTIVLPQIGYQHFLLSKVNNPNIRYIILTPNPFDNSDNVLFIFTSYLIRSLQTIKILKTLTLLNHLHTASDTFVDIVPAFIHKLVNKNFIWSARFFHFIGSPLTRKGNLLRNLGAYILQRLSLKLINRADLVIVDNSEIQDKLINYKIHPNKIYISTGGVDYPTFAKPQISISQKYKSDAIFVGRFSEHKGVFDSIYAWSQVVIKLPNAKLYLLGYGPQNITLKIKQVIYKLHLHNNVKIIGFVHDRGVLIKYYHGSKMLLFLDYEAGFGLTISEVMASGVPVIAYKLPIFGKVYKNGFLLADFGDVKTVSNYAINLITNSQKHQQISIAARNEALKFDWNTVSNNYYRILNQHVCHE